MNVSSALATSNRLTSVCEVSYVDDRILRANIRCNHRPRRRVRRAAPNIINTTSWSASAKISSLRNKLWKKNCKYRSPSVLSISMFRLMSLHAKGDGGRMHPRRDACGCS